MHIIHIASELAPIAKVGGLGDVLYGLSQELVRLKHTVEIILPKYDCLDFKLIENLKVEVKELITPNHSSTIWSGTYKGLKLLLVEPHHPEHFFHRGVIYGCADDLERFTHFSQITLAYLDHLQQPPDAVHLHDWPTALVSILAKQQKDPHNTLLTIHNLEHQGKCTPALLTEAGVDMGNSFIHNMLQDPTSPELCNLLKGGILASDAVTTVSPNYQKEILTVEGGCGLHESLILSQDKLTGILNGIDEHFWNPEFDPYLVASYNTHQVSTQEQLKAVLEGKQANRHHLATHVHLRASKRPLVASVTRLVPQKSPELIKAALLRTLEKGGQFILLGTTQIPEIKAEFVRLQTEYQDNPDIAILLDYDEALSHLIFAAADLFVIPSLFEPCGLTQLIALRYGAVPLARITGGLADTVFDIDSAAKPLKERNGFTFDFPDAQGLYWALDRALKYYEETPQLWHTLMMQGMNRDFSWKHTAPKYVEIYEKLRG